MTSSGDISASSSFPPSSLFPLPSFPPSLFRQSSQELKGE
jgi:hypothetical protein